MDVRPTSGPSRGPGVQVPVFYNVPDAAKLIGTSSVTLYRAIRDGEFPAIKIRGRLIVPARVLDEMISAAIAAQAPVDAANWVVAKQQPTGPASGSAG